MRFVIMIILPLFIWFCKKCRWHLLLLELGAIVVEVEPQQFAEEGSLHAGVGRTMLCGGHPCRPWEDLRDLQARLVNIFGPAFSVDFMGTT